MSYRLTPDLYPAMAIFYAQETYGMHLKILFRSSGEILSFFRMLGPIKQNVEREEWIFALLEYNWNTFDWRCSVLCSVYKQFIQLRAQSNATFNSRFRLKIIICILKALN